jgi:hypothetical protein
MWQIGAGNAVCGAGGSHLGGEMKYYPIIGAPIQIPGWQRDRGVCKNCKLFINVQPILNGDSHAMYGCAATASKIHDLSELDQGPVYFDGPINFLPGYENVC